jgi:hypothetical protein
VAWPVPKRGTGGRCPTEDERGPGMADGRATRCGAGRFMAAAGTGGPGTAGGGAGAGTGGAEADAETEDAGTEGAGTGAEAGVASRP